MSLFYIASKLFTYLVLPPGMFIILFFLASFFAKRFKLFFFFCALGFYLLSNSFVANALLKPLEAPYKIIHTQTKADAVVVLGGGSIAGSPNLPLSSSAYKRALWGTMLAKSNDIPLLFSGAGLNKTYNEADAFLDSMSELEKYLDVKLPKSTSLSLEKFSILIEDRSLDTYENAKFSKELFTKHGIEKPKVYLVTSAFHMKRSIKLYEHFGFEVIPAATDFKVSSKESDIWDYFPSMGALKDSYTALHEYFGLLSLYLKGIY